MAVAVPIFGESGAVTLGAAPPPPPPPPPPLIGGASVVTEFEADEADDVRVPLLAVMVNV